MKKPRAIFVIGPWGSGTSVVASLLEKIGLLGAPPYLRMNDPRTPNVYESIVFRKAILAHVSETELGLLTKDRAAVLEGLTAFRAELLASHPLRHDNDSYFFKYALASFVLPELDRLFDARFIYVVRPGAKIENTRVRRAWSKLHGASSSGAIYSRMFKFYVEKEAPTLFVRYHELLADPQTVVADIVAFSGVEPSVALSEVVDLVKTP